MPRRKQDVEQALTRKGFKLKEGDHHYFVYYSLDGLKTSVFTKTSHSPKMREISDNLLAQMARQCKVSKHDFLNLVDCPLTRESYEEKIQHLWSEVR